MDWMVKARTLLVLLVIAGLAGCASPPRLRDAMDQLPPLETGNARVFFYGDTVAWKSLRFERLWLPILTIDGEATTTPNAREVVFVKDLPAGEHTIAADNRTEPEDEPPPADYKGQSLTLDASAGETYYINIIRHGPDDLITLSVEPSQHYLQLKRVQKLLGEIVTQRYGYLAAK